MVGEYKTTIVCNDCRSDTVKVYRKFTAPPPGQSRSVEVRGLRRCRSNDCRSCPLKRRDVNAAMNIALCWPAHLRPQELRRGRGSQRLLQWLVLSWCPLLLLRLLFITAPQHTQHFNSNDDGYSAPPNHASPVGPGGLGLLGPA